MLLTSRTPLRCCQNQRQPATVPTAETACDVDVAIVGGGPAGLAAAAALRGVLGDTISIRVFESRVPSGERGAQIQLDINGLRALEAIDPCAVQRMYERGIYSSEVLLCDDVTGERVPQPQGAAAAPPPRADFTSQLERHGHACLMMQWWTFAEALEEALPPGMVVHGLKLVDCAALGPEGGQEDDAGAERGRPSTAGGSGGGGDELGSQRADFRYGLTLQRCAAAIEDKCGGATAAATREAATAAAKAEGGAGGAADGDGTVLVRARWLVGADGYFSRVRRQVGDGRVPVPSGEVIWWGMLSQDDLDAAGAAWPAALRDLGPHTARTAGYSPQQPQQLGGGPPPRIALIMRDEGQRTTSSGGGGGGGVGGRGFWYLRAREEYLEAAVRELEQELPGGAEDGGEAARHAHGADGPSPAAALHLHRALATFSHLPPDVRAFLAATPPGRVTERRLCLHDFLRQQAQPQAGAWTDGRGMVLVGDAAHAGRPDGQGANAALEDAAVLGALVRQYGLGREAFSAYEQARWPRVKGLLTASGPVRAAFVQSAAFPPLWSYTDLPVRVDDEEAGLAWSRRRIRDIVTARVDGGGSSSTATATATVTATAIR